MRKTRECTDLSLNSKGKKAETRRKLMKKKSEQKRTKSIAYS